VESKDLLGDWITTGVSGKFSPLIRLIAGKATRSRRHTRTADPFDCGERFASESLAFAQDDSLEVVAPSKTAKGEAPGASQKVSQPASYLISQI
jgi:hypothetical protein